MQDYKRVIIIPYKTGSGSARRLRTGLQQLLQQPVLIVPKTSKTYQPRWTDYVINWGCSSRWEFVTTQDYLGDKHSNTSCVNKLTFFERVTAYNTVSEIKVNIPEWTTSINEAKQMKGMVVCRTILKGHSGNGIILANNPEDIINAPLYVKYKKKRHEYRVHVFNGEVIDVTQKRKRKGAEHLDTKIRNHQNGWVYCRENIEEPHDLHTQAINAMSAVGLKFGAVDIIWNEKENKSYVLEINCAPGLEGTSLTKYVDAFVKDMQK